MAHHRHSAMADLLGVPEGVFGPPPAGVQCIPVPGADLNPDIWNRNAAVHEIQATNGSG